MGWGVSDERSREVKQGSSEHGSEVGSQLASLKLAVLGNPEKSGGFVAGTF